MEFSIQRVWLLCIKQWAENRQVYLWVLLIVLALILGLLINLSASAYGINSGVQAETINGALNITGALLTVTVLSGFDDKAKSISKLLLPVSALEKLVATLIFCLVLFPLVFLSLAYIIITLMHWVDTGAMGHINDLYKMEGFFTGPAATFLIVQAAVMMLSVIFKRFAAIKTVVTVLAFFFALQFTNNFIAQRMLKIPAGPPFINTADQLPIDKWDAKTYLMVNKHQVYYDENHKVLVDRKMYGYLGGKIVSTPFYDKARVNDVIPNFNDRVVFQKKDQEVPSNTPFTVNNYLTVSDSTDNIFKILMYLSVPLMWLITFLRLKEIEL